MSKLYKPLHSDETIKKRFEPYTKLEGIHLDKKVYITEYTYALIIEMDIQSSFEPNESTKLKNYLRNNNFHSNGNGTFTRYKIQN